LPHIVSESGAIYSSLDGLSEGWYYLTNNLEGLKKRMNGGPGKTDGEAGVTEKKWITTDFRGNVINLVDENNRPILYEPTKTTDDAGNVVVLADGNGNPIAVVDANGARVDSVAKSWPN
jgi:hypothetical protein